MEDLCRRKGRAAFIFLEFSPILILRKVKVSPILI
jgi:hypothetical protein